MNIIHINNAAAALLDYGEARQEGKSFIPLFAPDRSTEFELMAIQLTKGVHVQPFNTILHRLDNTSVRVRITPVLATNDSDAIKGILLLIKDIEEESIEVLLKRHEQEDFKLFFDFNPNYCYRTSADGVILDVNKSALKILQYAKEELVGMPISAIYPEDAHDKMEDIFERWKRNGTLENEEIEIEAKNGERRTVILNVTALKDADGKITSSLSIQQDITERKTAEETLVDTTTQLRRTQAIAHVGAWDYDSTDGSLQWSAETFRIFGLDPETFHPYYERFLEVVYPEDREAVGITFERSIEEGLDSYEIKHRIVHGITGKIRWVHEKCFHQWDREGKHLGSSGMVLDITEQERLTREYEQFYQAIQYLTNAVIFTDIDGTITQVNPGFEKMYGFTQSEVLGQNPKILNPGREVYYDYGYTAQQYDELFSTMWRNITDPEIGSWDGEVLNKTKLGEIYLIHLYINAIKNQKGEIVSFVAIPIDVSTQRAREQEVRIHTYTAIADLAEQRDNDTGQHMKRISEYTYFIANQLRLSKKFCEDIRIFSPLHDIGKVGITDNILLAERILTEKEFELMKTHTTIGYQILQGRPTLELAAEIARGHHEKYDGSGYPQGLQGDAIPLSARITAVADVYDALRSSRPYKQPFPEEKTFAIITEGSGTHFDPDLIDVFIKNRSMFDQIFQELTD